LKIAYVLFFCASDRSCYVDNDGERGQRCLRSNYILNVLARQVMCGAGSLTTVISAITASHVEVSKKTNEYVGQNL